MKKYLLSATFLCVVISASSQDFSKEYLASEPTPGYQDLDTFDIDQDGDFDLVNLNPYTYITWFENKGGGIYSAPKILIDEVEKDIWGKPELVDVDGDGLYDILGFHNNTSPPHELRWLKQTSPLNFNLGFSIASSNDYYDDIVSSDFDNDGDVDFAVIQNADSTVAWFENLGGGNFSTMNFIDTTVILPKFMDTADFNNDGYVDLMTYSNQWGGIYWYENLGNGSFSTAQAVDSGYESCHHHDLGDINGDGYVDILVSNGGNSYSWGISWYENLTNGTFSAENVICSGCKLSARPILADMDLDGDLDLVHDEDTIQLFWTENDGFGNFTTDHNIYSFPNSEYYTGKILVADDNGDGDPDIKFLGNAYTYQLESLENLGGGIFDTPIGLSSNMQYPDLFEIGDFNNDGHTDFIVASMSNGGYVKYVESLSYDEYEKNILLTDTIWSPHDMCAGDFDNDGDQDFILLACGQGLLLYENQSGSFSSSSIINSANYCYDTMDTADFDNDGDLDIVVEVGSPHKIFIHENLGGGIFGPEQIITTGPIGQVSTVKSEDMDGDGLKDIVYKINYSYSIDWFKNLGGLTFSPTSQIAALNFDLNQFELSDLDNDNDIDVVASRVSMDSLVWIENLGAGTFSPYADLISNQSLTGPFKIADIDTNGYNDIVMFNSIYATPEIVVWIENTGSVPSIVHPIPKMWWVDDFRLKDVNNDSVPDMVYFRDGLAWGHVGWYENDPSLCANAPQASIAGLIPDYCIGSSPDSVIVFPFGGTLNGPGLIGSYFHPSLAGVGQHQITYDQIDTNNCYSISTFNITVHSPVASIESSDSSGCAPFTTSFTNPSSDGVSWLWNFGDGSPMNSTSNPNHTYSNSGIYTVTLTISDSIGCSSTDSISNLIEVFQSTADFDFIYSSGNCSLPSTIIFNDLSTSDNNISSWEWDFDDGGTSSSQNSSNVYISSGWYNVELVIIDSQGCSDTINQILAVDGQHNLNDTVNICQGDSFSFPDGTVINNIMADTMHTSHLLTSISSCDSLVHTTVNVQSLINTVTQNGFDLEADQNNASYQWIICNNSLSNIIGETNQIFQVTQNGNYAVIIDYNGCIDTSDCFLIGDVSINSNLNLSFNIFPNPATESIMIESNQIEIKNIKLIDIAGQEVSLIDETSNQDHKIYFNCAPGSYILRITTIFGVIDKKIIIQ